MNSTFRHKLSRGETLIGTLVTINSLEVAEIMARQGFDWIFIDGEHGNLSLPDIQHLTLIVQQYCPAIVRIPENTPVWIKKILDTGCDGIIVPQVKNAADARNAIQAAKYPPEGERSVGIARAQGYGLAFAEYVKSANKNVGVIIQIEHIDAVKNLDQILAVKGIDGVLIGPYDLSGSMQMLGEVTSQPVQDAIKTIKKECKAKKVPYGIFVMKPDAVKAQVADGCSFIAVGIDTVLLGEALKSMVAAAKGH